MNETTTEASEAETLKRKAELDGLVMLAQYPEIMARAADLAERRALRMVKEIGDISAEAVSETLSTLGASLYSTGMPNDDDDRARLVSLTVRQSVARCATRARRTRGNDWRAAIRGDEAPSDAPNAIEQWSDTALMRRADRYTMGKLNNAEQAKAVINACSLASLTPCSPRRLPADTPKPLPACSPGTLSTVHTDYWQNHPHRSYMPVGTMVREGTPGLKVTKMAGSSFVDGKQVATEPSAERTYWRSLFHRVVAGAIHGSPSLDAAADHYRAQRVVINLTEADKTAGRGKGDVRRPRFIGWKGAALQAGANDRGAFARKARRMASRIIPLARSLASLPTFLLGNAPTDTTEGDVAILATLPSIMAPTPTHPQMGRGPDGFPVYYWPGQFISRGDDTYNGSSDPAPTPLSPLCATWLTLSSPSDRWYWAPLLHSLSLACWQGQVTSRYNCSTCGGPTEGRDPAHWFDCPTCRIPHSNGCHHAA